jgi:hypothetical protein
VDLKSWVTGTLPETPFLLFPLTHDLFFKKEPYNMESHLCIAYKSGYKYQLAKKCIYKSPILGYDILTRYIRLEKDGTLTIYQGYCWDGPSGPTIDSKSFMRGSLIHDALYQLLREGHLPQSERFMADKILQYICLEDGMCSLRAWWVFKGVRKFAASAADPSSRKKIHAAP